MRKSQFKVAVKSEDKKSKTERAHDFWETKDVGKKTITLPRVKFLEKERNEKSERTK
jgi:hypothetical protein